MCIRPFTLSKEYQPTFVQDRETQNERKGKGKIKIVDTTTPNAPRNQHARTKDKYVEKQHRSTLYSFGRTQVDVDRVVKKGDRSRPNSLYPISLWIFHLGKLSLSGVGNLSLRRAEVGKGAHGVEEASCSRMG